MGEGGGRRGKRRRETECFLTLNKTTTLARNKITTKKSCKLGEAGFAHVRGQLSNKRKLREEQGWRNQLASSTIPRKELGYIRLVDRLLHEPFHSAAVISRAYLQRKPGNFTEISTGVVNRVHETFPRAGLGSEQVTNRGQPGLQRLMARKDTNQTK